MLFVAVLLRALSVKDISHQALTLQEKSKLESENPNSLISISPVIKCVYLHYSLPQPIPISNQSDFFISQWVHSMGTLLKQGWQETYVGTCQNQPPLVIPIRTYNVFLWRLNVLFCQKKLMVMSYVCCMTGSCRFISMINGCSLLQIRCLFVSYNSISPYSYYLTCNMPNLNIRRQHSNLLISFLISFESLKKEIRMKCQAIPPW